MATTGEKRAHSQTENFLENVKATLFDIEGTTTPINFVKEKLFSYVKDNVQSYLDSHFDADECQEDIDCLRKQAEEDKEVEGCVAIPAKDEDKEKIVEALVSNVKWQVDRDAKNTALKQFQGHIYREAYKTGKLQGEVFQDFAEAVKRITASGKQVYIYSSGSVEAQKLLFAYSNQGDLSAFIAGYYDTTTGSKSEKESYTKIASEIGVEAKEVTFFTDIPAEAKSANEAGMNVVVVKREGNAALTEEEESSFNTVTSFEELAQSEEIPSKKVEKESEESNGAAEGEVEKEEDAAEEEAAADEAEPAEN